MTNLMIATPIYNGTVTEVFTESLLKLNDYIGFEWRRASGSLLWYNRNRLADEFLKSDCDTLLWVDADMGFEPEAVFRLLDFYEPFRCGSYPAKDFVRHIPDIPPDTERKNGFAKVHSAGTGFLMHDRSVLEAMIDNKNGLTFEHYHGGQKMWSFFNEVSSMIDENTRVIHQEDVSFCARWIACGGSIWCDTESKFKHQGAFVFE